MDLLVCIINQEENVNDILTGFVELGVTGATLIKSEGMGRALNDLPVFAGLQTLLAQGRPQSTTILSVIEDGETLDRAIRHVRAVCGDMTSPGTGILFTVPVERVVGLAEALRRIDDSPEAR